MSKQIRTMNRRRDNFLDFDQFTVRFKRGDYRKYVFFSFFTLHLACKFVMLSRIKLVILLVHSGPVHTYPEIFVSANFFYADTKISASTRSVYELYTTVHTYPIRIRTSQRISQQSMRITKKAEPAIILAPNSRLSWTGPDTVTSAYTKIYGYERPHVSGYTAYTEISTLESIYRNLRIHRVYTADT